MRSKPSEKKKDGSAVNERPANSTPEKESVNGFPIAAIGASAGGIEAFTELVRVLPKDTGMAFVLIQHLDPKHKSMLADLLSRETVMKVAEVTDGMKVEPDHVYVIPPNASMTIMNEALLLAPRTESRSAPMAIAIASFESARLIL